MNKVEAQGFSITTHRLAFPRRIHSNSARFARFAVLRPTRSRVSFARLVRARSTKAPLPTKLPRYKPSSEGLLCRMLLTLAIKATKAFVIGARKSSRAISILATNKARSKKVSTLRSVAGITPRRATERTSMKSRLRDSPTTST